MRPSVLSTIFRFRFLQIGLVLILVTACATVPMTDRHQFILIPDNELLTLSIDQYGQVLSEAKLSKDKEKNALVTRVGERLAVATERYLVGQGLSTEQYKWEFNVIDDDETQNAWCMPGGKIAVYTGILPTAKTEAGLAVVMGHEIAHAVARHGNERMSQGIMVQMGGTALSQALKDRPEQTQTLFNTAYGALGTVGLILPYSRLHESEADRIGLMLMAMAGYDPRESVPFWERMNAEAKGRAPEFISTHPAPETRINNLKALMPQALEIYGQNRGAKAQ